MKKQMSNIKKANLGKGLGNGIAFGVTSGIAVSFAREIIQAIEDAKLEKKRRNPKTDSNTVVLHIPKELEKPASARDDFDDVRANDGKEIELTTPERDTAGRFTPNWVSKQGAAQDTAALIGAGVLPTILGAEYVGGMAGGLEKTKDAFKNWWDNYSEDTGTILGSTVGIIGGYILARKLAQKLEEARLKREIAAAQQEYANLLTGKKASCDILDIPLTKVAGSELEKYLDDPEPTTQQSSLAADIGRAVGSSIWEGAKSLVDPSKQEAAAKGREHAPVVDPVLAKGVEGSATIFAGGTVMTILAALAIAHVTRKILKQKYGNPNIKKDVVPRTTSVILKASEDKSYEIRPSTALVALGLIKDAMAYEMNKPVFDGIKSAQSTYQNPYVKSPMQVEKGDSYVGDTDVAQLGAPAAQPQAATQPQQPPPAIQQQPAAAQQGQAAPSNKLSQLTARYGQDGQLVRNPHIRALMLSHITNPANGYANFRSTMYDRFGVNQEDRPEIKTTSFRDTLFSPDTGAVGVIPDMRMAVDLNNLNDEERVALQDQLKNEMSSIKNDDPRWYNAFVGDMIRHDNNVVNVMNNEEFAPYVDAEADKRIEQYFSPKPEGSNAPTTFGNAISSGWLSELPFYKWLRQLTSWLFKNTGMGRRMGMRMALGNYVDNPGEVLNKALGGNSIGTPTAKPLLESIFGIKTSEDMSKLASVPGIEDIANINMLTDSRNTELNDKLDLILGSLPGSRRKTKRKYVSIQGDKETRDLLRKKRKRILKIIQELNAEYAEQ